MTLTDLKSAVLQELRIVAVGEPAPPEYVVIVGDKYATLYDMLLTKGLVAWTATADLPDYADQPVTMMLAYLCAGPLGVSAQRRDELAPLGALDLPQPSLAERQLRRQLAKNYVPYAQATEYF